jgi:hypothetical protein
MKYLKTYILNFILYLAVLIAIYLLFLMDSVISSSFELYSILILEVIWSIVYSRFLLRKYLAKKFAYMPFFFLLLGAILMVIVDTIFRLSTGAFGGIYLIFLIPPVVIGIVFTAIFGEKVIINKQKRSEDKNV